ncbi:M23 family metallopeptidase [Sphingomonas sp. GlSt437]|uniref:M23 family metallopeptidase n=1 Tax=Sphingomonas sp. GlSt437 TaxID=3389970 RepID=UPI003A8C775E
MTKIRSISLAQLQSKFKTRDFILHDGRDLRRFSVSGRSQAAVAAVAGVTLCFSIYGVGQAAAGAVVASGALGTPLSPEAKVVQLQTKLQSLHEDVEAIKRAAAAQAQRVEQRQKLIAAVVEGKTADARLALNAPVIDSETAARAADVIAPLRKVEAHQVAMAVRARQLTEHRYAIAVGEVRRLGIAPERFSPRMPAMGGPYEPVTTNQSAEDANADAQFRSLFMTWKKLDSLEQGVIAIPSGQPVANINFTSFYGVRSDPFRGTPAMHPGVDIPGSIGTPIYATADGVVSRAERAGGYGNMVEIDHGRGIATRYGHLSKILIGPNTRVKRGQLIALMGSTGRSTGSHLHYEVRIDGKAVNPIPFLQTNAYLASVQQRAQQSRVAVGGPAADQVQ